MRRSGSGVLQEGRGCRGISGRPELWGMSDTTDRDSHSPSSLASGQVTSRSTSSCPISHSFLSACLFCINARGTTMPATSCPIATAPLANTIHRHPPRLSPLTPVNVNPVTCAEKIPSTIASWLRIPMGPVWDAMSLLVDVVEISDRSGGTVVIASPEARPTTILTDFVRGGKTRC